MREIPVERVSDVVEKMCIDSNIFLGQDVLKAIKRGLDLEESPLGRDVLEQLVKNTEIAMNTKTPICQDTGTAVFFLEIGQEVHFTGGYIEDAINEGVARGYEKGYLRKSIVLDPLRRVNTGDNTPAVIHTRLVPGDRVRIVLSAKGGGGENMSALKMLKPADGEEGVIDFVLETVERAGPNPCPPIIVGVGVGGNFEQVAFLAKKALIRKLGNPNPDEDLARLEEILLEKINDLGIGPQGFGGRITALDVHVEKAPAHIASLPVAVNINCHVSRHLETII